MSESSYDIHDVEPESPSQKERKSKSKKGFSPEKVVQGGELVTILNHKGNPNQKLEVYKFNNYAWVVVTEGERLVTTWPSRKAKREFKI
ncbi:MAG: hypothetical protein C5B49_01515 [Bdellovibrio sp.]|nr:MAG: hypothetical protein C5B49_01515 [Bdellovibrio sp.]